MAETTGLDSIATSDSVPVPASASAGPLSHAIFRVARLHRMRAGQLLRQVGLHPTQELVMMQLWDRGPQRQSDLARLVDADAATMTRTMRRLEAAGYVRRRPCEQDRRVSIVESTPAGLALRNTVEQLWNELEGTVTDGLTEQERISLLSALEGVESRLAAQSGRVVVADVKVS